jgi:putative serine protease PepD
LERQPAAGSNLEARELRRDPILARSFRRRYCAGRTRRRSTSAAIRAHDPNCQPIGWRRRDCPRKSIHIGHQPGEPIRRGDRDRKRPGIRRDCRHQGDIVTNAHVVGQANLFRVYLATGKSYDGKLIGAFVPDDLAVIRITAPDLRPAVFGDSDHLRVGSIVMAVGSPLGLQSSVTEGIVSALGRQVTEPNGTALPPLIQTSADINPGNSGGALVDLNGEVIGIPTLAAQDPQAGGTAPGIGFAIPSNVAKDIAAQLIKNGRVTNSHRAYLGVQGASLPNGSGVSIYAVVSGGPADKAGLKTGDVITAIGEGPTPDQPSMASVLSGLQPGQSVQVQITRPDGSVTSLSVTLGELPG